MKRHGTKWLVIAGLAAAIAGQSMATPCVADCDRDGKVGFSDLVTLLRDWGRSDKCVSDINGDGKVNFPDLTIMLQKWGPCPE